MRAPIPCLCLLALGSCSTFVTHHSIAASGAPEQTRARALELLEEALSLANGYLVPYLLEERITNIDQDGYTGPDGTHYTTSNFERDIRMPERSTLIAEDLYDTLTRHDLQNEKLTIFVR